MIENKQSRFRDFTAARHHFQIRRVNDAGDISWHKKRLFISEVFRGEDIGLEKIEEGFYKVHFCSLEVGEFDVNDMRFRPGLRP
jgi:hypothetical protein